MDKVLTISKTIGWLVIFSIAINLVVITTQIIVQSANQEFYISIGFPFHFFYFNEPHGLHGSNILHFIYDGLLTLVLATIVFLIFMRISRRNINKNRSRDVLDSE